MRGLAKKLYPLLIIVILGILQVTILDYFKIFTVKPDLLLISMALNNLNLGFRPAFALSLFAGLFKDVFGVSPFGINTILFGLWSFLIARLSREITIDNNITRVALIFIVTVMHNVLTRIILIYLGRSIPLGIFLRIVCVESIYTAAVSWLVFRYLTWTGPRP